MTIYFYSVREEYGCFSNFSAHAITLKGKRWPTTEHYFQAQKFPGTRRRCVAPRRPRMPQTWAASAAARCAATGSR